MLGFAMSDKNEFSTVDVSKYESRRFHDSKGREIAVFDGLVDKADLDALRLFLLQYNSVYAYQPYDGHDEEHDNVSWIAMIKVFILYFNKIRINFYLMFCRVTVTFMCSFHHLYSVFLGCLLLIVDDLCYFVLSCCVFLSRTGEGRICLFYQPCYLIPRVFLFSNMAAVGGKTLNTAGSW